MGAALFAQSPSYPRRHFVLVREKLHAAHFSAGRIHCLYTPLVAYVRPSSYYGSPLSAQETSTILRTFYPGR